MKDGRGVLEEQVEVDYDVEKYKMKETQETRSMIEMLWRRRTQENSRIYNASKFRLAGHGWDEEKGRVVMRVGLTDYKDHVGTNLSPDVDQYMGDGDEKYDLMSQCVGVGAWVITTDHRLVFVENAAWKGEQGCKIDRPGGHAEPGECGVEDETKIPSNVVRAELFDCIRRELRDEVNIDLDLQHPPELLGGVYNLACGGRLSE